MARIARVARAAVAAGLVLALAPPAEAAPYRTLTGIRVQAERAAVTVIWVHDGDRRAVGYRVTAVSQQLLPGRQPVRRTIVAPPTRALASVVFRDLKPQVPYVFWIEVIGRKTQGTGLYYEQVFSSPGVRPL